MDRVLKLADSSDFGIYILHTFSGIQIKSFVKSIIHKWINIAFDMVFAIRILITTYFI